MATPETLLAIRMRQLGDVLTTLGALRAIKSAVPEQRIAYMVDSHYHELLQDLDYIDVLLHAPPKINGAEGAFEYERYVQRLRRTRVDRVVDFHSNTRSAVIAYLSGAPIRVGFDVRVRKALYTSVEPRAYFENGVRQARTSHESAVALAERCLGRELEGSAEGTISVAKDRIELAMKALVACGVGPERLRGGVIGINPGNPYPSKEWGEESFVELSAKLIAAGWEVVVLWGPGEEDRARRIALRTGRGAFVAPALSLVDMAGVVSCLAAVVTIDSGLKHLAVALGVPSVTLFGPTSPYEWHTGGTGDRYLFAGMSCSPCRLLECPFGSPCMSRLTPDAVAREVAGLGGANRATIGAA